MSDARAMPEARRAISARARRLVGAAALLATLGGCGDQDGALSSNRPAAATASASPDSPTSAEPERLGVRRKRGESSQTALSQPGFFNGTWSALIEQPPVTRGGPVQAAAPEDAGARDAAPAPRPANQSREVRKILRGISLSFEPSADPKDGQDGAITFEVNGYVRVGTYTARVDAQSAQITADFRGAGREVFVVSPDDLGASGRPQITVKVGSDTLTLFKQRGER